MYCDYCGRNFESEEGYQELVEHSHRRIKCEECVQNDNHEQYDWREKQNSWGTRGGGRSMH